MLLNVCFFTGPIDSPDIVLARISLFLGENAISTLFVKKKKAVSEIGQMRPFLVQKDNLALIISRSKILSILKSNSTERRRKTNAIDRFF